MNQIEYTFSEKKVNYFLDASFSQLDEVIPRDKLIVVTDKTVFQHHPGLARYKLIVVPAGELHKNQSTVDFIIQELIKHEADRRTFVVGIGGGVVTDITGFAASIYMRGIRFGFVPTTILAQVDASIGGKNGIDAGLYKNMVGVIRQPDFILFDHSLLQTLSDDQWINGFAEIIKHSCIKDESMFEMLERHHLEDFKKSPDLLAELIQRNVVLKSDVVQEDEFETGERKLLNFGHTLGHAIENMYSLPHGHAISIGMSVACQISEAINNLPSSARTRVVELLHRYHLPTSFTMNSREVFDVLKMDKKRTSDEMNFILLNKIGEAVVRPIQLSQLELLIKETN